MTHFQIMFKLCALIMLGLSSGIMAAESPGELDVCVRNFYPEGSQMNPCNGGRGLFRKVLSADDETRAICTKAYEDMLCDVSPREYRRVVTADGDFICTVHFHQPGVGEYCYSNPKEFSWAKGHQ